MMARSSVLGADANPVFSEITNQAGIKPKPHMKTFETEQEAVQALFDGEVDFYAGNFDVAKALAKKIGKDSAELSIVQPPINEQEIFVMFSKATENGLELRDAFNKSLINLQASGQYDAILSSFK